MAHNLRHVFVSLEVSDAAKQLQVIQVLQVELWFGQSIGNSLRKTV
jgi:hypothetical protein